MFPGRTLAIASAATLLLAACSGRISDSEIASQVGGFLRSDIRTAPNGHEVAFSRVFELKEVVVNDKLIKEKELVAQCAIHVRVLKSYGGLAGWDLGMAYPFLKPGGDRLAAGSAGEVKSFEARFLFEKYERGWKIKEIAR